MQGRTVYWYIRTIVILLFLTATMIATLQSDSNASPTQLSVADILNRMTPEERIGQLFLIEFHRTPGGWDREPRIEVLIQKYKVGGVVFLAANENLFNGRDVYGDSTLAQVASLTNTLQKYVHDAGDPPNINNEPDHVPLLIAIDHEGDGYPYTRIISGTTPLPSNMALNATWSEQSAEKIGQIVGRELRAMGINMLLGPVIDVLDRESPSGRGNMGVRVMGSDPDWVGILGRAYVRGVHEGGQGRVATVVKHFPGHGGSNRLPDESIAIIPKNVEELRKYELVPFARTTNLTADDPLGTTDALMTSHIEYQGDQDITEPVSLDRRALARLLALEEFAEWNQKGLIVSDSLGVNALTNRGQYSLNAIARDSLMAGNDLLVITNMANWGLYTATINCLNYFTDEYEVNPTFKRRVDEAAKKVITLKRNLYPEFSLEKVLINEGMVSRLVGQNQDTLDVEEIAREAVTLVHPTTIGALKQPPTKEDHIVIISNSKLARDCFNKSNCPEFERLPRLAIEDEIRSRYGSGPRSLGAVNPDFISSWTFDQLASIPDDPDEDDSQSAALRQARNEATWIIFALVDWGGRKDDPSESDKAINRFLDQPRGTHRQTLVAIAYGAPYYLDSTEIDKLDAYYAVYSKTQPFIKASVRALFQDLIPQGKIPVEVGGRKPVPPPLPAIGTSISAGIQSRILAATLTTTSLPKSAPSNTPTPSHTPTRTPTITQTATLSYTPTPSQTPIPTMTPTITPAPTLVQLLTNPEVIVSIIKTGGLIVVAVIGLFGIIIKILIPLILRRRK